MSLFADQIQADRTLRLLDWGSLKFQPVIERGGEIYALPRPILQFEFLDTWDNERLKALLVDGDSIVGSTRNGVDFRLAGEIGSPAGETCLSATEMFAALSELRTKLHVGADDEKYRFYLLYDVESAAYRYFQACTTLKLVTDLSNPAAFQYRLVIHAEDPTIYDTAPGE